MIFIAFLCISTTAWQIIFKRNQVISMMCIGMSERMFHSNTLKFQGKRCLQTGQKSPLVKHSLFWCCANFSKLMRTIHFFASLECKTLTIFALRRMKNIGMVSEKLYRNTLRSFSNSHQHSYFELKVLAGLNQERAKFCFW